MSLHIHLYAPSSCMKLNHNVLINFRILRNPSYDTLFVYIKLQHIPIYATDSP